MRIIWGVTLCCTLQSLQFHNQHQWFLSQQTQQQRSLIWACHLWFPQLCRPLGVPVHHRVKVTSWFHVKHQLNIRTVILDLTLHSNVNFCLSSRGLPLAAGYSQSRSNPSKPCFLSSLIEDWINVFLMAFVDTIVVNLDSILGKERGCQDNIYMQYIDFD